MHIINITLFLTMGLLYFSPIDNINNNLMEANSTNMDTLDGNNDESYKIWGQNKIELNKALELSRPTKTIRIGVLDTGIEYYHDALKSLCNENTFHNYTYNSSFSSKGDISKDGHGTHISGIIASVNNYSNIELVSYRVMNNENSGTYKDQIEAINQASKDCIDILNISSSGKEDNFSSIVFLKEAIEKFNGLVICSAGNNKCNLDHSSRDYKRYPACIDANNVITVGASSYDDLKSDYSNYGKTSVDLFAPGDNIYSCVPTRVDKSGYKFDSGTSMSTPMVTGVAALLLSNNPSLTTSELKDAILSSVDKIDALEDKCVTGGRLNAYKALKSIHQHNYVYEHTDNLHTYKCICGEVKTSFKHNYEVTYDAKTHLYKCVCGLEKSSKHIYTFKYIDRKSHGDVCECGYYKSSSPHIIKPGSISNSKCICLECDATLDLNYDMGLTPFYDIVYITSNGSYKLPNGIIVLSDIDYASYINGTLSFNYNDMLLS